MNTIHTNINIEALTLFLKEYTDKAHKWSHLERDQLAKFEEQAFGKKPNLNGCPDCIVHSLKKMNKWLIRYNQEVEKTQKTEPQIYLKSDTKNKNKQNQAKPEQPTDD